MRIKITAKRWLLLETSPLPNKFKQMKPDIYWICFLQINVWSMSRRFGTLCVLVGMQPYFDPTRKTIWRRKNRRRPKKNEKNGKWPQFVLKKLNEDLPKKLKMTLKKFRNWKTTSKKIKKLKTASIIIFLNGRQPLKKWKTT